MGFLLGLDKAEQACYTTVVIGDLEEIKMSPIRTAKAYAILLDIEEHELKNIIGDAGEESEYLASLFVEMCNDLVKLCEGNPLRMKAKLNQPPTDTCDYTHLELIQSRDGLEDYADWFRPSCDHFNYIDDYVRDDNRERARNYK